MKGFTDVRIEEMYDVNGGMGCKQATTPNPNPPTVKKGRNGYVPADKSKVQYDYSNCY